MRPGEEKQMEDYRWFLDHYDDLFAQYGDSWLAIKSKQVIGVYSSFQEGITEMEKKEAPGSFIIQHCNGNESGYTDQIVSMNFMGAAKYV